MTQRVGIVRGSPGVADPVKWPAPRGVERAGEPETLRHAPLMKRWARCVTARGRPRNARDLCAPRAHEKCERAQPLRFGLAPRARVHHSPCIRAPHLAQASIGISLESSDSSACMVRWRDARRTCASLERAAGADPVFLGHFARHGLAPEPHRAQPRQRSSRPLDRAVNTPSAGLRRCHGDDGPRLGTATRASGDGPRPACTPRRPSRRSVGHDSRRGPSRSPPRGNADSSRRRTRVRCRDVASRRGCRLSKRAPR